MQLKISERITIKSWTGHTTHPLHKMQSKTPVYAYLDKSCIQNRNLRSTQIEIYIRRKIQPQQNQITQYKIFLLITDARFYVTKYQTLHSDPQQFPILDTTIFLKKSYKQPLKRLIFTDSWNPTPFKKWCSNLISI